MTAFRILHVGCGGEPLPPWLGEHREIRLDIDPRHKPDVLASMTDMGSIGQFDVVYNSHSLEHLYPHDVPVALGEFLRVLRPGGVAILLVPDLEGVQPTDEPVYESHSGWITGHDMYYGYARVLAAMPYMAHHCGFVSSTLAAAMTAAGFVGVHTMRGGGFNLIGIGGKA